MKLTIFYSWQMTTDVIYNKDFILECINEGVMVLEQEPEFRNVEFIIQNSTANAPGSPVVPTKINDERIPKCDIFIADLTIINRNYPTSLSAEQIEELNKTIPPTPNPNVLIEFGVAYDAIGVDRILSFTNGTLGSIKENDHIIPFDIRLLKWPIEYKFSQNQLNKALAKTEIMDSFIERLRSTAIFALQYRTEKHHPFLNWEQLNDYLQNPSVFYNNPKLDEIYSIIKKWAEEPKSSLRLIGLSGLGKTRILHEIFKPLPDDPETILNSSRVLYLNFNNYKSIDLQTLFRKIKSEDSNRIIILDNCDKTTHRQLLHFINEDSNLGLISIDSNPEEINQDTISGVEYIYIKKEDLTSVVNDILVKEFSFLNPEQLKKIIEFSQGIPLMAVLIAESIRNGEKFIGKLDDKVLLDKLLGEKGNDNKNRKILKSCSIFNYFGIEDEVESQIEFISRNRQITKLSGEDFVLTEEFKETCNHFLKREIFEKKGRYIGMRPLPLALSLAVEWIEQCSKTNLLTIIEDISNLKEPDRTELSKAFAEQMRYLGYNNKANLIVESILGPDSPFDNAEVLNTKLGSRLFRSFVEVNPEAVMSNLMRNLSVLDFSELEKIKSGRRNLVLVLEKLCFDKRTFSNGAKLLYNFAIAENETWANNANGQFIHLFNIFLSGTQASLEERFTILEWGWDKNDLRYNEIAFQALQQGLKTSGFNRMSGPEIQGTRTLIDNHPTNEEIIDYWNKIIDKLHFYISSQSEYKERALDTIANNIRGIVRIGLPDLIIEKVEQISSSLKVWDSCLYSLKLTKQYEADRLNGDQNKRIDKLIRRFTKTDFISKYERLNDFVFEHDYKKKKETIEQKTDKLALSFINQNKNWIKYLSKLYQTKANGIDYRFGSKLSLNMKNNKEIEQFLSISFTVLQDIPLENRNVTLLGGFASELNKSHRILFYKKLLEKKSFEYLLFYFVALDPNGKNHFPLLINLVNNDSVSIQQFTQLRYSKALENCSFNELEDFKRNLLELNETVGYQIVFELFFYIGNNDPKKKKKLIKIMKECIYFLGYTKGVEEHHHDYKWTETICQILNNKLEKEFALFILKSIVNSISFINSYHLDFDVQKIFSILFKNHFKTIWPDLSNMLLSENEDYIKYYGLKHILGSRIGGIRGPVGLLFEVDPKVLFEWCYNNPKAPVRLAELAPIFDPATKGKWHPMTLRLINEFGESEKVLDVISTNMGNYSWTGSLVPLLENKKEIFTSLLNHQIKSVDDWARRAVVYLDKQIKDESLRDQEQYLF